MKKYLVLLASAALLFALLAGCKSESNNPPPVETTTSSVVKVEEKNETKTEDKNVQPPTKAVEQLKEEKTEKDNIPQKTNKNINTTEKNVNSDVKITKEEAKKTVLAHAGLSESDIKFYKSELDRERAGLVYEIEFVSDKYEYDYEVDAESGKITKAEKEIND